MAKELSGAPGQHSITTLAADPDNPRVITSIALEGLRFSMEDFGDLSGIVFNARTAQLVAGHQRVANLAAGGAMTWTKVDQDQGYIEHPKTGERFPIRIVDWPFDKQRRANLTANNPHIAGEFTEAALEQLRAMEQEAAYASLRLDALQKELSTQFGPMHEEPASGETDPDAGVEPPAEPITERGDLWTLGDHRLLCGDATNPNDVARLFAGAAPAMLFETDPPYGVDYTATKQGIFGAQDRWGNIANDDLKDDELAAFLRAVLAAAADFLAPNHAAYVWHPSGELNQVFRTALLQAGYLVHRQIIWRKPNFVLTRSGMYHWIHEPCFYGWRKGHTPPWYGEKNQSTVWDAGRDDGKAVHPTQKPVALFETPMMNHTRQGDVCYEPFSGSGSQIIAGERLGRRVLAIDISPRWCDAAVARWEAFTGRKAHRQGRPLTDEAPPPAPA